MNSLIKPLLLGLATLVSIHAIPAHANQITLSSSFTVESDVVGFMVCSYDKYHGNDLNGLYFELLTSATEQAKAKCEAATNKMCGITSAVGVISTKENEYGCFVRATARPVL